MKKPIFTREQRCSWPYPEVEVAKLKIKREFERSGLGGLVKKTVELLNKHINNF